MKHYDWNITNCSIINKLLDGNLEWNADELQYQINFPDDIENALAMIRGAYSSCVYHNQILLIPSYYSLCLRNILCKQYAKRGMPVRRVLTKANAAALALFANTRYNETIAIIVIDSQSMDLSILTIGDGVFEVKYSDGCKSSDENPQAKLSAICQSFRDKYNHIGNLKEIDHVLLLTDMEVDHTITGIVEKIFNQKPLCISNTSMYYEKGMQIQAGIINGKVKDTLLLDYMPCPIVIGCEEEQESHVIERKVIPMLEDVVVKIPSSGIVAIKEGDMPDSITVKRLILDVENHPRAKTLNIRVDVDANGILRIESTVME